MDVVPATNFFLLTISPLYMTNAFYTIEEWKATHPHYLDFLNCLHETAPDQAPFVTGGYYGTLPTRLWVAKVQNQVAGFLRIVLQPIGPEAHCPPLEVKATMLIEAKIHAFAVREEFRKRGIGRALQQKAIQRAQELGCFQLSSYSPYECTANHRLKLGLGFAAQPETHFEEGREVKGVYFLMPLSTRY